MDDLAIDLARRADGPRPAVERADDEAAVGRLAAAARIEHGPIEDQQGRLAGLDRDDPRLDGPRVGVGVAELLARRGHAAARGHWAVSVPIIVGWTVHTNA